MDSIINLTSQELKSIVNIKSINSAYFYNFHKDFKGRPEAHEPIELIYVDKGSQIVFEENDRYVVNQGQAFLHKARATHRDETNNVFTTVYILSFTAVGDPFKTLYNKVLTLDNENILLLKIIFDYIQKEGFESKSPMFYLRNLKSKNMTSSIFGNSQKIKNNLELFFINLLSQANDESKIESSKNYSNLTTSLINELKNQVRTKLDLDEIANKLFYTKSYICRKFKEDTGTTLVQYYYELKMSEAKMLLLNSDLSLLDISKELNFQSIQYFNYIFKKYNGLSPNAWRKISLKRVYF